MINWVYIYVDILVACKLLLSRETMVMCFLRGHGCYRYGE